MNYTKIYDSFIATVKGRKPSADLEEHQVIPTCKGGTFEPENTVYLTIRECLFARRLLSRIYFGNIRLMQSVRFMAMKWYELQDALKCSKRALKAWDTRRVNGTDKFSDEQRAKMSASQLAREETPEQAKARGKKAAETRRQNGTDQYSDESKERMRQSQLGKKQSPETVAKRIATRERNKALKAATTE
jgi:hypothetical protein